MKVLQINTIVNSESTGRIAEDIGKVLIANGHESFIAYGRGSRPSQSNLIKIGDIKDVYLHGFRTLLTDQHGLGSYSATKSFIEQIEVIKPDIIHLHNIHGYYINYQVLFNYIKVEKIPVVWTFHDCWPFTGHCSHFEQILCTKWLTHCEKCPINYKYPRSFADRSYKNFDDKKAAFLQVKSLTIITPSKWLAKLVSQSFLKEYSVKTINNGIDLKSFQTPKLKENNKMILGVASTWSNAKGLNDFVELRKIISEEVKIVLIGLSKSQIKKLPNNITGICKTDSVAELAKWYQEASVFVNPTYLDNFPTTNIEALACGTPVITYDTGGSPESLNSIVGEVVEKGNIMALKKGIERFLYDVDLQNLMTICREQAVQFFDKDDRYREYLEIYKRILN
ncbi:MAG: glycosyltransferase [Crocinitomicaceae bacterium]|nr:glycosyltransferase [Crocinitomicaceae bacterium]